MHRDRRRQPVLWAGRAREAGREERRAVPEPDGLRRDDRPDHPRRASEYTLTTSPSARASPTCWAPTTAGGSRSTSASSTTSSGSESDVVATARRSRRGRAAGRSRARCRRGRARPWQRRRVTRSSKASGPASACTSNVRSTARGADAAEVRPEAQHQHLRVPFRVAQRFGHLGRERRARRPRSRRRRCSAASGALAEVDRGRQRVDRRRVGEAGLRGERSCASTRGRSRRPRSHACRRRARPGAPARGWWRRCRPGAGACRRGRPSACPTCPRPARTCGRRGRSRRRRDRFFDDQSVRRPCLRRDQIVAVLLQLVARVGDQARLVEADRRAGPARSRRCCAASSGNATVRLLELLDADRTRCGAELGEPCWSACDSARQLLPASPRPGWRAACATSTPATTLVAAGNSARRPCDGGGAIVRPRRQPPRHDPSAASAIKAGKRAAPFA